MPKLVGKKTGGNVRSSSVAAVCLVGALTVAGCAGPYGSGYGSGSGYGYGSGGYGYGGAGTSACPAPQPYAFDPGMGGVYGQPYQSTPYYQSQPYAYYGNGGVVYTDPQTGN